MRGVTARLIVVLLLGACTRTNPKFVASAHPDLATSSDGGVRDFALAPGDLPPRDFAAPIDLPVPIDLAVPDVATTTCGGEGQLLQRRAHLQRRQVPELWPPRR